MIQAGRDLKRDRAYGKEGRGLWKKSSIGEKDWLQGIGMGRGLAVERVAGRPMRGNGTMLLLNIIWKGKVA